MTVKPGDWVQVYGQVVQRNTHPDDVAVEFFSHNEQFWVHIARDRVTPIHPPEHLSRPCRHLFQNPVSPHSPLFRCYSHENHGGLHQAIDRRSDTPLSWPNEATIGYIEDV